MSRVPTDKTELRKMLADLFANPNLLPPSLLSFLNDYNALNQPPIPASNIIGISGLVEVLDSDMSTVTVTNSSAVTTIYTYQVPANLLQTQGAIRVELAGTYVNNSGASRTLDVQVLYGGTVMWSDTSGLIGTSADTYGWRLYVLLAGAGSSSAQKMAGSFGISGSGPATNGYGDFGTNEAVTTNFGGTAAQNSKLKKAFLVRVKHSLANASLTLVKDFATTNRIAH